MPSDLSKNNLTMFLVGSVFVCQEKAVKDTFPTW